MDTLIEFYEMCRDSVTRASEESAVLFGFIFSVHQEFVGALENSQSTAYGIEGP